MSINRDNERFSVGVLCHISFRVRIVNLKDSRGTVVVGGVERGVKNDAEEEV